MQRLALPAHRPKMASHDGALQKEKITSRSKAIHSEERARRSSKESKNKSELLKTPSRTPNRGGLALRMEDLVFYIMWPI